MSIQTVAWALEQDLPARPKLVLVSIANHANHVDGYCWLKAETIATEAACKPRSVYRFVGDLIRNGYLRKTPQRGADGRQRANDYWILFHRDDAKWVSVGPVEEEEIDPPITDDDGAEPQDVASPYDSQSCGENTAPDDSPVARQGVDKHAVSCGPTDSGVSHKGIAEPSKSNPKASSAGARVRDVALRAYRPPPPQPLGADTEAKLAPVFVYFGSRAWDAWCVQKLKERGIRWSLTTRALIDGTWRTGWYFPTLFPPPDKPKEAIDQATGPPQKTA